MKFYEVMSQIVMTSHLVAFDVLCMNLKSWNAMSPPSRRASSGGRQGARLERQRAPEARGGTRRWLQKLGLEINTPDIAAFRAYAQKVYLASDEAKSWRLASSTRSSRSVAGRSQAVGPGVATVRPRRRLPLRQRAGVSRDKEEGRPCIRP